ncbi:TonB-dependent siderophore receptor [Marinobacter lutaoensis]|uniref:TonB-dependent siderophore receptor n=1 Tax=Marinobacter lutaoensis TaxID=135739 RepID=UPI001C3E5976|nr:TonB-dependent siderophore receptor [Marinobacter lutaoensis]
MRNRKGVQWKLCALALGVASSSLAQAQEEHRLEAITVEGNRLYDLPSSEQSGGYGVDAATVGTKTPASLRDIPQSITVLTHDYVQDRQFVTLDQAAKYTPGIHTLANDDGRSSIFSRGYEYSEYNVDGLPAPISSLWGTLPLTAAFDRIEIMRGPSGLFNSTSELGGIINMVRKRPTETFQGHLEGRLGSDDLRYLEADLGGTMDADGDVRGRVVASAAEQDSFVDVKENRNSTLYTALDIDLDHATTLGLGWLHQTKDMVPGNGLPAYQDGTLVDVSPSTFMGADWNRFENDMDDVFLDLTHRFDNGGYGRLAARGSWRDTDLKYAYTAAGVDANGDTSMAAIARVFSEEALALDASYSRPFAFLNEVSEFVVGADAKRYDTEYDAGAARGFATNNVFDPNPHGIPEPDIAASQNSDTRERELGTYAKLTLRPWSGLALIGGARLSWYQLDSDVTNLNNGSSTRDHTSIAGHVTPYAGLVQDLDPHHSLYLSYSEVFKPQTETGADGGLLKPRQGNQLELGVKGSYLRERLNARLTLFRLTDENRAATPFDDDGNPISEYKAASGKTRIHGAEVEVSGELQPGWDLLAGYTYMDTKTLDGDEETLFQMMPRHQAMVWTQYQLPGAWNQWHMGAGVTAMSDVYLERSGIRVEAPGYAVVDAMVRYDVSSHLTATLNVNNLFDREYYARIGSPATFNFYGAPASVVAGLRYDF